MQSAAADLGAGASPGLPVEKILLVSWGVPPHLGGTATIVENLSRQFAREELVIAGERFAGGSDYKRDPRLPEIHYVDREWTWPKRGQRYVRWARWFLLPLVAARLNTIARHNDCRAIVAVFPNEYYLLAACLVARWRRLPFYPYFHNTYLDGPSRRLAQWFERHVFQNSPVVFVMSEGMRLHYERTYPGVRFEPLVHTFHEPIPEFAPPPPPSSPVRLAFLGNLNDSNVDAARRLVEVINQCPDCTLTTYSATPDWFFAKAGVRGPRVTHTRVAYDQVQAALASHDVLLLPHGLTGGMSQVEYDTIFPTRTIPYLISRRPILAHTPPDCFLTRWLRKHDCAELVDRPDHQALRDALDRLCHDQARREQLVRNALVAARQFYGPAVAADFRHQLRDASGAATNGNEMRRQ
jgi:glycosyltransferase involved in cell wall biosynthesis